MIYSDIIYTQFTKTLSKLFASIALAKSIDLHVRLFVVIYNENCSQIFK